MYGCQRSSSWHHQFLPSAEHFALNASRPVVVSLISRSVALTALLPAGRYECLQESIADINTGLQYGSPFIDAEPLHASDGRYAEKERSLFRRQPELDCSISPRIASERRGAVVDLLQQVRRRGLSHSLIASRIGAPKRTCAAFFGSFGHAASI